MKNKIINKTSYEFNELLPVIEQFLSYSQDKMRFDRPVDIELISDEENAKKLLGKTAYYDPDKNRICIFVDGRHPKDILRSISHELMHHAQNCRGDFEKVNLSLNHGYAQEDGHLRDMEKEAYAAGIIFRDFEDGLKYKEELLEQKDFFGRNIGDIAVLLTEKWAKPSYNKMKTSFTKEEDISFSSKNKNVRDIVLERIKVGRKDG